MTNHNIFNIGNILIRQPLAEKMVNSTSGELYFRLVGFPVIIGQIASLLRFFVSNHFVMRFNHTIDKTEI